MGPEASHETSGPRNRAVFFFFFLGLPDLRSQADVLQGQLSVIDFLRSEFES